MWIRLKGNLPYVIDMQYRFAKIVYASVYWNITELWPLAHDYNNVNSYSIIPILRANFFHTRYVIVMYDLYVVQMQTTHYSQKLY